MKRIVGIFFVLGLSISTLASNLPANSQSVEIFKDPTEGEGVPIDAVVKGDSGLNSTHRQKGANIFCQRKGFNRALPNFLIERDSTIGTMQWDLKTEQWVHCESCKMYLKNVTCQGN